MKWLLWALTLGFLRRQGPEVVEPVFEWWIVLAWVFCGFLLLLAIRAWRSPE